MDKYTKLENAIENLKNQQTRDMSNLGELAKKILELQRRINEHDLDIKDLQEGHCTEHCDHG